MKKIYFAFLLLVLTAGSSFAQQKAIDSLNAIIAKPASDTALVNAWIELDNLIYLSDPKLDEELNKKILSFSQNKIKSEKNKKLLEYYKAKELIGTMNMGIITMYQSNNEAAKKYFSRAVILADETGNKQKIAAAYNNFGVLYYRLGDYPQSIEHYTKAFGIMESRNDLVAMAGALNNIANIYREIGDTAKALSTYHRSLKIGKKSNAQNWVSTSLSAIAETYSDQGRADSVELLFMESLNIDREIGNIQGYASNLANLGKLYLKNGKMEEAKVKADSALLLFKEINDHRAAGVTLGIRGEYFQRKGDLTNAIKAHQEALDLLMSIGQIQEAEKSAFALYHLYKLKNDYKSSLEAKELYDRIHDTLQNEKNTKAVLRQEYKYEYEKRAALDEVHQKAELDKKDAELKKKRQIQITLIVGLIVILIFAGFIFNRFKVTSRLNVEIEKQKAYVEEKNRAIVDSINYAKRLQDAILPPEKIVKELFPQSFILYKPKDIVAGDFYWFERKNDQTFFAAADCTGHGVPGAMVSVICNNGLNRSIKEYGLLDPGEILDKTREIVIQEFEKSETEVKDGMDISLCTIKGTTLYWAGANNPLWIIRNGEFIEFKPNKQPIGKYADQKNFTSHSFELMRGDSIYLFTDGFADQFGGDKGKKFKTSNLRQMLTGIVSREMNEQKILIDRIFEDWKGNFDQVDDVCLIGIKF